MVRVDNNKHLWQDKEAFEVYTSAAQAIVGITNKKPVNVALLTHPGSRWPGSTAPDV